MSPKEKAWHTLQTACTGDKATDRANATRVLGLIRNDVKATKLAEKALSDLKPEVRAAAAAALGDMNSRRSIPKLKKALDDENPLVALAAAHSLHLMRNNSAYEVYSEILAKQRKGGKGLISSQMSTFSDPKKMAQLGFEEGIGFVPFAGIGWKAIKEVRKDDSSPGGGSWRQKLASTRSGTGGACPTRRSLRARDGGTVHRRREGCSEIHRIRIRPAAYSKQGGKT